MEANALTRRFDEQDLQLLDNYAAQVTEIFSRQFREAGDRLTGGHSLLTRFSDAMASVKVLGRTYFHAVDETHNELCIASALLKRTTDALATIAYEPPLQRSNRTIDFVATRLPGGAEYTDVKTIHPARTDRWEQFEKIKASNKIPDNIKLVLSKDWLGGELWHGTFAARAKMLEYALELETKIREAHLTADGAKFLMMFCGEGFWWHGDQLEDFVQFYRTGRHRADDPFSAMESWYITNNNIKLDRTISSFGFMRRDQFDIHQTRLNWDARPPRDGL